MLKVKNRIGIPQLSLSLVCLLLTSCGGWLSDSTEDLAGNYKYVFESRENSLIYGGVKEQKVIPCTVESYAYSSDFILAQQKASKECVFPHNIEQEEERIYFWIVDIKNDTLYRADSWEAYEENRTRLHVPEELQLEKK
ncbi:DUF3997 domain-containing protein [Pontibacter indicus]|uniref:DUF3997 domain-containing protein n=1 Tax=Pontibacter indicus TaxID=1317125 RepID=UPI0009FA8A4F|nr:DUF3997 domain-containing protein [Pontibacter indicus]